MKLTFIGAGKLGGALAIALARRGYAVENVVSRDLKHAADLASKISPAPIAVSLAQIETIAPTEIVFITTVDSAIAATAARLAELPQFAKRDTIFLHTSGALSSEILAVLRDGNGKIGSLHPLVSVSDSMIGADKFANAYFCIEGESEAVAVARKIVTDLGGNGFSIAAEHKPLYHAAAVTSAGHTVALFDAAAAMLENCGLANDQARRILLPLLHSAVENLSKQTPSAALTGTFARADVDTLQKHLAAIKALDDANLLAIYLELGKRSLKLAREQGADTAKIEQMLLMVNDEL